MQIRQAEQRDVEVIAQMWHAGWHQAHAALVDAELVRLRTLAEFGDRTAKHLHKAHVIMVDDSVAGFVMIDGDEIYQFYVGQGYQGRGVAAQLMAVAEGLIDAPVAWLACAVGNTRAAAFYRKAGWRHTRSCTADVETSQGPRAVQEWIFEKTL